MKNTLFAPEFQGAGASIFCTADDCDAGFSAPTTPAVVYSPAVAEADRIERLTDMVNATHTAIKDAEARTLTYAYDNGKMLIELKRLAGRGNWEQWAAENLRFSVQQARKYMAVYEHRDAIEEQRRIDPDSITCFDNAVAFARELHRAEREAKTKPEVRFADPIASPEPAKTKPEVRFDPAVAPQTPPILPDPSVTNGNAVPADPPRSVRGGSSPTAPARRPLIDVQGLAPGVHDIKSGNATLKVTVVEPEKRTTLDEVVREVAERRAVEDAVDDRTWVEGLPLFQQLSGKLRDDFAAEAIMARRFWAGPRKDLVAALADLLPGNRKPGAYFWRFANALKQSSPENWTLCLGSAGGCDGTGFQEGMGEERYPCPACDSRGFMVPR